MLLSPTTLSYIGSVIMCHEPNNPCHYEIWWVKNGYLQTDFLLVFVYLGGIFPVGVQGYSGSCIDLIMKMMIVRNRIWKQAASCNIVIRLTTWRTEISSCRTDITVGCIPLMIRRRQAKWVIIYIKYLQFLHICRNRERWEQSKPLLALQWWTTVSDPQKNTTTCH